MWVEFQAVAQFQIQSTMAMLRAQNMWAEFQVQPLIHQANIAFQTFTTMAGFQLQAMWVDWLGQEFQQSETAQTMGKFQAARRLASVEL